MKTEPTPDKLEHALQIATEREAMFYALGFVDCAQYLLDGTNTDVSQFIEGFIRARIAGEVPSDVLRRGMFQCADFTGLAKAARAKLAGGEGGLN